MILDGHGPLHAQLTRALRAGILQGRFAAGGFIEGRVGSGSYVARHWPASAGSPSGPAEEALAAQSRYAARARETFRCDDMPGRAIPGGGGTRSSTACP